MGVTQNIQKQISKLADGTIFKYEQLNLEPQEFWAAAKAIERMIAKGSIKRVKAGVFYKPKQSVFGELPPNYSNLLKELYLFEKGKRIGYVTGTALYNQMHLTTQMHFVTRIVSNKRRNKTKLGWEKIIFLKAYVEVNEKNYELLGLLDALKDFNKIPDINISSAIIILSNQLKLLNTTQLDLLVKCALKYPPRVRAFLGTLLEKIGNETHIKLLKESLNPLSEYEYNIIKILPNATNWNIK